jgi:hypothetical protein
MPTDILCKNSANATFSASHNGAGKSFLSNKPPMIREDYPHISPVQFGGGGSGVISFSAGAPQPFWPGNPVATNGSRFAYLLNDPISPTAKYQLFVNGSSIGIYNITSPEDSPVFNAGDSISVSVVGAGSGFMVFSFAAYAEKWGHRVSDQAGQTEIFKTGSTTKPAPFTHSCGGQCPPGQVKCGDCCIDCKTIAAQIAAIGARL